MGLLAAPRRTGAEERGAPGGPTRSGPCNHVDFVGGCAIHSSEADDEHCPQGEEGSNQTRRWASRLPMRPRNVFRSTGYMGRRSPPAPLQGGVGGLKVRSSARRRALLIVPVADIHTASSHCIPGGVCCNSRAALTVIARGQFSIARRSPAAISRARVGRKQPLHTWWQLHAVS